jgi:hypothetical protein
MGVRGAKEGGWACIGPPKVGGRGKGEREGEMVRGWERKRRGEGAAHGINLSPLFVTLGQLAARKFEGADIRWLARRGESKLAPRECTKVIHLRAVACSHARKFRAVREGVDDLAAHDFALVEPPAERVAVNVGEPPALSLAR